TNIVETDPVNEAGMKQHFHRLRLHSAEEKLGAFAMKFLERYFERVQAGGINCRHGTHSKNHHARHTQGAGESGFELLRHAEEKRTFNPKYEHAFRHIFFTNGIAPELQLTFGRDKSDLRDFFHSPYRKRARNRQCRRPSFSHHCEYWSPCARSPQWRRCHQKMASQCWPGLVQSIPGSNHAAFRSFHQRPSPKVATQLHRALRW